jgi:hypothetical protein
MLAPGMHDKVLPTLTSMPLCHHALRPKQLLGVSSAAAAQRSSPPRRSLRHGEVSVLAADARTPHLFVLKRRIVGETQALERRSSASARRIRTASSV